MLPLLLPWLLRSLSVLSSPADAFEDKSEIWFPDIESAAPLSIGDMEKLARFAASAIRSKHASAAVPELSSTVNGDSQNRVVFLSVGNSALPARVFSGAGKGVTKALEQALAHARAGLNSRDHPEWIKLDIVRDVHPRKSIDSYQLLSTNEKRFGLALDREAGTAFLPEELISAGIAGRELELDRDGRLSRLQGVVGHMGGRRLPNSGDGRFFLFTTNSVFCDEYECFPLFNGHRVLKQASGKELLSAARMGGTYLKNAVNTAGRFAYIYRPASNSVSESYNIVRHAGTIYAMLELYEITRDQNLLNASRKAINYLLLQARPCAAGSEPAACIVEGEYTKLGGNALAALALAKYIAVTGDRLQVPMLIALGRRIVGSQDKNGEFFIQKQSYPEGTVEDYESEYYPGEALFALTRIYAVDPQPLWLDAAEKGARFRIGQSKWPLSWKTNHDHWLLYALNELHRLRPDASYLDHSLRIADAIMTSQNRDSGDPDRLGGYFDHPRSTPAATRTEGLCAAYRLARDFNRPREAEKMLEAIRLGADFLLQMQFRPESVMYFEVPQRGLGGFRGSLTDTAVRIDYVQHTLSALLGLYRILDADRLE